MQAVQEVFPGCCIHFEDWKGTDAIRILERYRDKVLCFNDDIQGTARVAFAGLTTALQIKNEQLTDQRVLFLARAPPGSARPICSLRRCRVRGFLSNKLVLKSRSSMSMVCWSPVVVIFPLRRRFTRIRRNLRGIWQRLSRSQADNSDRLQHRERLYAAGGGNHHRLNVRPIIFALSNPTDKAECTAEQAYRWSNGKALFAAGVQFPDVNLNGQIFHPGQANNFYIYPAIALATYVRAHVGLDACFVAAAEASSDQVGPELRARDVAVPGQARYS